MPARPAVPLPPASDGLYDPSFERDACGVGFVAHLTGSKSHRIVQDGLLLLLQNLQHRGACGCDQDTGDGAGILLQMPDPFFREEAGRLGIALPAVGALRRRVLLPADRTRPSGPACRRGPRDHRRRGRTGGPRLAAGAGRVDRDRLAGPVARAGDGAVADRPSATGSPTPSRVRATPLRHPPPGRGVGGARRRSRPGRHSPSPVARLATVIYKGMLKPDQLGPYFPDLARPGDGVGPGPRPQPVQHEHVPAVGARPAVPHARPQRRDQHPPRQRHLAAGPPSPDAEPRPRRRPSQDAAARLRRG